MRDKLVDKQGWIALLLACAVIPTIAVAMLTHRGPRTPPGVSPDGVAGEQHPSNALTDDPNRVAIPVLAREVPVPSIGYEDSMALLEDFWGSRWRVKLAEYLENGGDLELLRSLDVSQFGEWEGVKEGAADLAVQTIYHDQQPLTDRLLSWGMNSENLDVSAELLNPEGKDVPKEHMPHIRELSNSFRDSILGLAEEYADALAREIRTAFNQDRLMYRQPLFGEKKKFTRGALFSSSGSHKGWSTAIELLPEDYPYLAKLLADIMALKADRRHAIADYIAGL